MNVKNSRIYIVATSVAIMFLLGIFLFLNEKEKESFELTTSAAPTVATSHTQTVREDVVAEPIIINGGAYLFQQEDNPSTTKLHWIANTVVGDIKIGNTANNTPVTTKITAPIDLANYKKPSVYKAKDGSKTTYTANQLNHTTILSAKDFEFIRADSYGILKDGVVHLGGTKLHVTYEVGDKYNETTKEVFHTFKNGVKKYKIMYATPFRVTWHGYVDIIKDIRSTANFSTSVGKTHDLKAEVATKTGTSAKSAYYDVSNRPSETIWKSDNPSVVKVDNTGKITALKKGTATVHVNWKSGEYHITTKTVITVKDTPTLDITGNLDMCFDKGKTTLTVFYSSGQANNVTALSTTKWISNDTSIATVDKGVVTFKKEGEVTITVQYQNESANVVVTIKDCTVPSVPTPDPTQPTQPLPPNLPPIVDIEGKKEVQIGEFVCYSANASDPDGFIAKYEWHKGSFITDETDTSKVCGTFEKAGDYTLIVVVEDNGNANGGDIKTSAATETIKVIAPQPQAYFMLEGTLKENRKITVRPSHAYGGNNLLMQLVPIVKETLVIEAVDKNNQSKIKVVEDISGNVDYMKVINFLAKFSGEVKISRYVENSEGNSDYFESVIQIAPDLAPTADFELPVVMYRETPKSTEYAEATINLISNSVSIDDEIQKYTYRMKYDSNNDGSFDDEQWVIIGDTADSSIQYKTKKVGKYLFEMEVYERFVEETIPQFVDQTFNKATTDLRFANTDSKPVEQKIVEVDNLAPIVSISTKKAQEAEIQFDAINSPFPLASLEASLPYLKNELAKENIMLSLVDTDFESTIKKIESRNGVTLVLLENGDVYGSGGYSYTLGGNPLGLGSSVRQVNRFTKIPLPLKAVDIFTNGWASQFIMEDGTVYGTGNNSNGDVGSGNTYNVFSPIHIDTRDNTTSPFVKAKKIINSGDIPTILFENGIVQSVGQVGNHSGNGERNTSNVYYFTYGNIGNKAKLPKKAIDIAPTASTNINFKLTTFTLEDGRVYGSGNSSYLESVDYQTAFASTPRPFAIIPELKGARVVNVYSSGSEIYLKLNNGKYVIENGGWTKTYSELNFGSPIKTFIPMASDVLVLLENGDLYIKGTGHPLSNYATGSPNGIGFKKINVGGKVQLLELNPSSSSIFLVIEGKMHVMGNNYNGELGVGHYNKVDQLQELNLGSKVTKFKKGSSNMFNVSLNQTTTLAATQKSLRDAQEFYFVGGGTTANKALMNNIIQWNDNKGRFVEITPSNTAANIHAFYDELAKYIIETLSRKQVYVQFDTTNSPYTKEQINEMTAYANTILDSYGMAINTSFLGTDNLYEQKGKTMYMASITNSSLSKANVLNKMNDVTGYYVGIAPNNSVVNEIVFENMGRGTHISSNLNLKEIMEQLANYIIETESENGIEIQFLIDSSIGVSKAALVNKINSEFKNLVVPSNVVTEYITQADGSVREVEKIEPPTKLLRFKVDELTASYNYKDARLQAKNRFIVLLSNNSLSNNQITHLTASNLINNAHFIGVSNNIQSQLQDIVNKSMKKGTVLTNSDLSTTLESVANYVDEVFIGNKGKEELFITLDNILKYDTTYIDFEHDPLIEDYWLFEHSLGYFDSEKGTIKNNQQKIKNPITQFNLTGRYLPRYAAKDNPLRPFTADKIKAFENYQKWSDEADDLILFVHNKPNADFNFKVDTITGHYTISSIANDIDKQINVQQGIGLQYQKMEYRLKGDRLWIKGTPPSPLNYDDVYEVRNTAVDMQGETATVIKIISRKNLPPIAEFETDKDLYDVGEIVNLTNFSYDPNNDDLTAKWYVKAKNEAETSYIEFASGEFNASGLISADWNSILTNLDCQSSTLPCPYDIKLVVTDSNGQSDQMIKTIHVQMTEVIDIGIRDVEVFTAPSTVGLPVYLRLNETILVNNANNVEEARNTLVQVNVFRNGTLHQTENILTKELLNGHHFTINSNGVLEKDKEYSFEFVISSPFSEKIVVASGRDRIVLNARTAEEKTVTLSNRNQEYKALLSVKRSLGQEQVNVYETITLQAAELTPTVTGLGNSLNVSIAYRLPENQHYSLNMIAAPAGQFVYGAQLIDSYYDGAVIADGKATVQAVQTVNTTTRSNNENISIVQLSHPKVYVEKNTGHLFSEQQVANRDTRIKDTLLDGGHELYTPIWLNRIGDYNIHYKTSALGVNQVSFMLNQTLKLEGYMFLHINSNTKDKDKWLMEPVMKKNPFPNGLPNEWTENDVNWLKN